MRLVDLILRWRRAEGLEERPCCAELIWKPAVLGKACVVRSCECASRAKAGDVRLSLRPVAGSCQTWIRCFLNLCTYAHGRTSRCISWILAFDEGSSMHFLRDPEARQRQNRGCKRYCRLRSLHGAATAAAERLSHLYPGMQSIRETSRRLDPFHVLQRETSKRA